VEASFQTEPLNCCGNWLVRSGTAKCNAIAPRHRRAADNATVHFQGMVYLRRRLSGSPTNAVLRVAPIIILVLTENGRPKARSTRASLPA